MAWISFRVPNVCEALKTQKNPRHVPCPLKSNRTAVGLTRPSICFERRLRRWMDARAFASPKRLRPRRRVKPAHDGLCFLHDAECGVGAGDGDAVGLHQTLRKAQRAAGLDDFGLDGEPLPDLRA